MYLVHKAGPDDLDFLLEIDNLGEGYSSTDFEKSSSEETAARRRMMESFIHPLPDTGDTEFETSPKYALLVKDGEGNRLGLLMFLFRDMDHPAFQSFNIYDKFDREAFPEDGWVCEIFQVWVHPDHRRQHIATNLHRFAEETARDHGVSMIYTHAEAANPHVVEMYEKMGYRQLRTGPLWDNIIRTSLVKDIPPEAAA